MFKDDMSFDEMCDELDKGPEAVHKDLLSFGVNGTGRVTVSYVFDKAKALELKRELDQQAYRLVAVGKHENRVLLEVRSAVDTFADWYVIMNKNHFKRVQRTKASPKPEKSSWRYNPSTIDRFNGFEWNQRKTS